MASLLVALQEQRRSACRIIGRAVFALTLDLIQRLPEPARRARTVCVSILIVVARDALDRRARGMADRRGPSVNAVAASLNLPFETVRRNVQQLIRLGWIDYRDAAGLTLPDVLPTEFQTWLDSIPDAVAVTAQDLHLISALPLPEQQSHACSTAMTMVGLDMFLVMAGTSKLFDLRFSELLLLHFVCNESVRSLAHDPVLAVAMDLGNSVPPDAMRAFVPLAYLSETLGISRATLYRMTATAVDRNLLERRSNAVRATHDFLTGPAYLQALDTVAGRTGLLYSRLERHVCGAGCADMPPPVLAAHQISSLSQNAPTL